MQLRSEETHTRILEAAQKLFAQCGYDAAGVADICALAGVSKGAFYHHFPSKQAVFLELLNNWLGSLDSRMDDIRQGVLSIPQMLIQMSSMMKEVFQAADGRLPMFLEFWTQSSRDATIWKATIAPYHQYQAFFTSLIQDGIDEGSLRKVNPSAAARVIIALALGLLLQSLLDPHGADWEEVAKQGMQSLMAGLAEEARS